MLTAFFVFSSRQYTTNSMLCQVKSPDSSSQILSSGMCKFALGYNLVLVLDISNQA